MREALPYASYPSTYLMQVKISPFNKLTKPLEWAYGRTNTL